MARNLCKFFTLSPIEYNKTNFFIEFYVATTKEERRVRGNTKIALSKLQPPEGRPNLQHGSHGIWPPGGIPRDALLNLFSL